jgi:hypothetical protein
MRFQGRYIGNGHDNEVYQNKRDIRKASEGRYIGDGPDTSAPTDDQINLLNTIIGPGGRGYFVKGCNGEEVAALERKRL